MDELAVDTLSKFGEAGLIGSVCVLLILLLVYRETRYWPREIDKRDKEVERSHAAHELTRIALLEETRAGGQTLVIVREQLKAQENHRVAMETLMRLVADKLSNLRALS